MKQNMWMGNSEEIILLIMSCLYIDLLVLGILARSSRIFAGEISHGGVDGRKEGKGFRLGYLRRRDSSERSRKFCG